LELLRNSGISIKKWDELLTLSHYASAFQTPSFYKHCNTVPGLVAEVFAVEESLLIRALCVVTLQQESGIKSFFSRRAIIYGGPVLFNNDASFLIYLLTSIFNEFKRSSIYIEIRSLHDYGCFNDVFIRNGWKPVLYQNFIVDCTDKESLFKRLGNNRKRQIKKAISSGVKIREAEDLNEITEFYSILKKLYNKKIKKPLLPQIFFNNFFRDNLGKFLVVIYKEKIIGGIMCPILIGRCLYEFYVCGLDEEYRDQYPSILATWSAMLYANENNIPVFDFMGAGRKGEDYGVRNFKARFGGELVEYERYLKINKIFLYKIGQVALSLLRIFKNK
jgi:serine/alanine adding enzyme